MKIFVGPKQRKTQRAEIEERLRKTKIFSLLIGIFLPLIVLALAAWMDKPSVSIESGYDGVAKLESNQGFCSAFLVSQNHLITAAHCLDYMDEGDYLKVSFQGESQTYQAKILYIARDYRSSVEEEKIKNDYAVLELEDKSFESYYELETTDNTVKLTDDVIVAGYPGGVTFSAAKGSITGLSWRNYNETLQIMAGAWPGSSGGPVFDKKTNKVIGILNAGDIEMGGMLVSLKMDVLERDLELNERINLSFN